MSKYDDIINMERPALINRQPASRESRAAQFGAFRALTGYEDAVSETARLTDDKLDLSENTIEILNGKLMVIKELIDERPVISVTYFKHDDKKTGGEYLTAAGSLIKIDEFERKLIFSDKSEIPINLIADIECDLFDYYNL